MNLTQQLAHQHLNELRKDAMGAHLAKSAPSQSVSATHHRRGWLTHRRGWLTQSRKRATAR